MPVLSKERLKDLATLCAAGAIIVLTAAVVIVAPQNTPLVQEVAENSLTAAVVCASGSCTDTVGPLTITANPNSIVAGSTSTISWSVGASAGTTNCFGNNAGTCGSAFQSALTGIHSAHVFTVGAHTYVVGRNASTNFRVYRWMPAGTPTAAANPNGCLGNGTTCGSNIQSVTFSGYGEDLTVGTIGSQVYLFASANINGWNSLTVYKWMPSCGSGLGGFGNGTTCGTHLQSIQFGAITDVDFYTIGSNYFVMASRGYLEGFSAGSTGMLLKWMPTCNSGQGGLGNGTTCGTSLQTIGVVVSRASFFSIGGNHYLTIADDDNGAKLKTYRFMSTCSSNNGGFGNGTTCGSALQTINTASAYAQLNKTFFEETITDGTSWYALVSHEADSAQTQKYVKLYKWIPASNCFGSGTTCGTHTQQLTFGGESSAVFYSGSTAYVVLNSASARRIYKLLPAQDCIGNDTTCGTAWQQLSGTSETNEGFALGSSMYLQHGTTILKAVSTAPTCSVVWSPTDTFTTSNPFSTAISHTGLTTGPLTANRWYRLSCTGVATPVTVPVTVVAAPTVTISASAPTVNYGSTVNINATFGAGAGDVLTNTAINGPAPTPVPSGYTWTLAPGLSWTPPTNKTFVFNPQALGLNAGASYTFIPDVSSQIYPGWNHSNNQSVTVSVVCASGTHVEGGTCVSNGPRVCSPQPPNSTGGTQTWNGSSWSSCTGFSCISGYVLQGGVCESGAVVPVILDVVATPNRVRKGTNTTINWTGTNLPADTCTLSSSPSITGWINRPVNSNTTNGSAAGVGPITRSTVFTFTCGAVSDQVTVGIVPTFQEI